MMANMLARDVYPVVTDALTGLGGLATKDRRTFMFDHRVRVTIQLNKHGWDACYGWGYFIRLVDVEAERRQGALVDAVTSITPEYLIHKGYLPSDIWRSYTEQLIGDFGGRIVSQGLFQFYTIDDLRAVTRLTARAVICAIKAWSDDLEQVDNIAVKKRQELPDKERARVIAEMRDLFSDFEVRDL